MVIQIVTFFKVWVPFKVEVGSQGGSFDQYASALDIKQYLFEERLL